MNRSNSFVNALKWWPLQSHQANVNQTNAGHTNSDSGGGGGGGGFRVFIPFNKSQTHATFGSSVAVQKLRESKWFKSDEQRIFCAVVESGFIVELRSSAAVARKLAAQEQRRQRLLSLSNKLPSGPRDNSSSSNDANHGFQCIEDLSGKSTVDFCKDSAAANSTMITTTACVSLSSDCDDYDDDEEDLEFQDENETPIATWFGIVLCKTTKDNKPKPETIEIFSVKIRENGTFKMLKMSLEDIWKNGWELRINNFADKEKPAHNEKDIKNQVSFARKAKHSLWNNNQHFVYWCRYGSRQQDVRKRQMSECVKWGSVGMNAGMLLVMNKKSYSTSK
ncbi:uncharacterized protein LOC106090052 [Stomoxys calcitrans]|uniref:Uncharacterized protein n=1 Tax=Stomoxys calcitrans TaxID=35570 RepID=A0A1I8PBA6_STOCA|nr:uncharacterized protein LOC106090052 [Stomoxys calcitrans]XP_059222278.1 uncharacterized protein LOC106090052 [Stomoxys calcitrans]